MTMTADPDSNLRVGLIGLGNAGQAMLQALSAKLPLTVYDTNPERAGQMSVSGRFPPTVAASARDVARNSEVVILSLPTPAASLSVTEKICSALGPRTILLETSTVGPEDVEAIHAMVATKGTRVIDAAIVGGVHNLSSGNGLFLAGAQESEAGAAGAVLRAMSEKIFFLGRLGDGMRMKLIVNAVAHAVYVVLVEAGALAAAQNMPLAIFYELMQRETGLMRPLTHRFGERLRENAFVDGMPTVNARKDSGLILETARALGAPLFAIQAAHSVYELAVREGLAELDYASVGRLWERWLNISFGQWEKLND
jgi:3-hydroxyisobutyrate dehydrogenase-like beta-hydroxyacid dehydrogenase